MSDRKKIIFSSIAILSTVSVVVAAFVFWILYEAAFDQERKRLIDAVRGQARILESIASFDENMVAESSAAAVMQVRDAYSRHITFGRTGEVLFARREGDSMVFLLRHFGPTVDKPESIPFSSQTAEPMRRALSGESGWVIGIDYRGEPVLSAYEPVEALGIGIVAKTDISEIRAPFIQAGIRAGALSFAVIVLGSLLILSTSSPIIRRVEKSECTLKESEYFSAKMLESSISGLYILDFRQAEKIYISPAYTRITGHSPGDPYKMEEFYSSFHPDDLPRVIEHMDLMRQASDEDILEIEYRFKAADGRWLWCLSRNAVFERDEAGSVRQIIGSFLDITERRNAEASLRESEARYRELVENANSAIIRWRSDGTVTFFNEYAQAFFGYTESEIIGRHVGILVPERESSGTDLTMLVKDIVTHPERYLQNVNENIRRDGTRVWMAWTNKPMLDANGSLVEILAMGTDITERKRMELELEKAREELEHRVGERTAEFTMANEVLDRQREVLQTIIDNIPVMLCFYDSNGKVQLASRELEKFLGWSIDDMKREDFDIMAEVYPDAEYRQRVWDFMLHPGQGWRDFTMRTRHGRIAEASWANVRLSDGSQIGIGLDISERKRAELALQQSEERFRLIAETIQDVFWMSTPGVGKMLYVSPAYEKIWGRTKESLYKEPLSLLEAVHPGDRDLLLSKVKEHAEGSYECEYRIVQPDGSIRWIHDRGFPIRDNNGELSCMVGVASDVTEKRAVQEALERSESLLRAVIDSIPVGVWVIDAGGNIMLGNPAGWKIWGGARYVGIDQYGLFKGRRADTGELMRAEDWAAARAVTRGEISIDEEIEIEAFDGTRKIILSSGVPVKDAEGGIMAAVAVNQDITDRKQNEEALNATLKKLHESNQALQDFTSIASHDMQEPLRKVISFGRILKRKYGVSLAEDGKDYLDRVLHATERMQSLLDSLLDYSRVTSRVEPVREVDLASLISEVLSDLEVRIESTGATVECGRLPVIQADPNQMRQLFQNLIGNALKFHKENESPVVRVRCSEENSGHYDISVEDNGIGFDEKNRDKIFAPFHRLHGRSSYEGAGMGLAICKKIVERHGGRLTARSTPGKGAKFIVTLPKSCPACVPEK